jgi:hypothetical protein
MIAWLRARRVSNLFSEVSNFVFSEACPVQACILLKCQLMDTARFITSGEYKMIPYRHEFRVKIFFSFKTLTWSKSLTAAAATKASHSFPCRRSDWTVRIIRHFVVHNPKSFLHNPVEIIAHHTAGWFFLSSVHSCQCPVLSVNDSLLFTQRHQFWSYNSYFNATSKWRNK